MRTEAGHSDCELRRTGRHGESIRGKSVIKGLVHFKFRSPPVRMSTPTAYGKFGRSFTIERTGMLTGETFTSTLDKEGTDHVEAAGSFYLTRWWIVAASRS